MKPAEDIPKQSKPKLALYWCASCGGCEESVFDLAEDLLTLAASADILFWPVALDAQLSDVAALDRNAIDICLINGAVRTDEQEEMVRLLREKSRVVMAHGACAHTGGVVGLANFFSREAILDRVYRTMPTVENPEGRIPGLESPGDPPLTAFHRRVRTLGQVVDVDCTIPGCPPTPELMKSAIFDALSGKLPPKGTVLGDSKALCHSCPRLADRPEPLRIGAFRRFHEVDWDPSLCFLDQGLVCMGPATRGGCRALCISANMPCRGCFGPPEGVADQGAHALAFFASLADADTPQAVHRLFSAIPDPAGLFYRYGLAAATLPPLTGEDKP